MQRMGHSEREMEGSVGHNPLKWHYSLRLGIGTGGPGPDFGWNSRRFPSQIAFPTGNQEWGRPIPSHAKPLVGINFGGLFFVGESR